MSWRVLNISKLRWLTIEYFCLCTCPKSQRFFLKAPWYTLNNYFCEEIQWTSASVFMETWTRRRNRGLWTCSEEPGCGAGAGSACSLPGYLTFSLFLDMAGPPELGRDRLVGEGCSLLFLGSNKLGFFHSSNDQAWRESSLDIFLAACTCLTCWPLASAPELSGEKWGAFYVTASAPIRTEIWTLPLMAEGLGKVQVWSVPLFSYRGLSLCSGGHLRTGRMETMTFQLMIPTLSNCLAWGQLCRPFKTYFFIYEMGTMQLTFRLMQVNGCCSMSQGACHLVRSREVLVSLNFPFPWLLLLLHRYFQNIYDCGSFLDEMGLGFIWQALIWNTDPQVLYTDSGQEDKIFKELLQVKDAQ